MKNLFLLILPLLALSLTSCNKDEEGTGGDPGILFKKIYTMRYTEGNHSEIVQVTAYTAVQLHGHILSGIHFTAENSNQSYEFTQDEYYYEDDKLHLNGIHHIGYPVSIEYSSIGYFCTDSRKTSNFKLFQDIEGVAELVFELNEVQ